MWIVRSPGGQHAGKLLELGVVGIGWRECAPFVVAATSPEDFYTGVRKGFPEFTAQQVVNAGRQLYKFFREIRIGDLIATYDSPARIYHVGKVTSDVVTDESLPEFLLHFRRVEWLDRVERDELSLAARNSLGSSLTLFEPSDEANAELERLLTRGSSVPQTPVAEVEAEDPFANALENSRELIKDRLMQLSWQDMQRLVAGILRAMGYKTKISPEGADRGKDIIASPDGLGLEHPRIFVEVKHRRGSQMGAPEVRKFIGGRDPQSDRCLYVSTGGFSTEARYEAERSRVALTLIDSDDLVELLVDHYDQTDAEVRTLIPLRRTYWPT